MDYGVALGRRFRSLKLWMVLRAYGADGLAAIVSRGTSSSPGPAGGRHRAPSPGGSCSRRCRSRPSASATIPAVTPTNTDLRRRNEAILEKVNATGRVFISHTQLRDRYALRVAIGNLATSAEHVDRAWGLLRSAAAAGEALPPSRRHNSVTNCFGGIRGTAPAGGRASVSSRKSSWREPATGIAISAPSTPRSSPPSSTATRIRNAESCTVRR